MVRHAPSESIEARKRKFGRSVVIVLNGILVPSLAFAVFPTVDRASQLHENEQAVVSDDVDGVQNARQLGERYIVDALHLRAGRLLSASAPRASDG